MAGAVQPGPAVIVGGGVAGLTVALAMRQRGADVTVLEKASALTDIGAGLQLSPNAMRVLDALGLAAQIDAVSLPSRAVRLRDGLGRDVVRLDLAAHRPGARFRLIHRARLIEVLASAARDAGVRIKLDCAVRDLPDVALLIGADGLHSQVRAALNGREVPFFTGQTAWRAVIADDPRSDPVAQVFMGPGRHLVSYPLAGGLRNIVAVLETRDWQDEGWSREDDPANLSKVFQNFGGPVPGWLARIRQVHVWGLFRHQVADRWQDGRMVIMGDAAHPTLPFMAQGACMAIEDGWLLAACLAGFRDQHAALHRFEDLQKPRAARIVAAANDNARNYHLTGAKRIAAHTALRLGGRIAPSAVIGRFDWIYDYDPTAQSL